MDHEALMKWKEAGVLFEFSPDEKHWYGPMRLTSKVEYDELRGNCPRYRALFGQWYDYIRPCRSPGHIQPHDGSSERPEWVAEDALLLCNYPTRQFGWWTDVVQPHHVEWSKVSFFIVLPVIGGNNEQ